MKMDNKQGFVLTRDLYKQFKSFDREKMQAVLTNVYLEGKHSAEENNIDLDELRAVIGSVNRNIMNRRTVHLR